MRNLLFIGIQGHVLALDRATGEEVWRTKLKGSDFVSLVLDGSDIFASAQGRLFCLDSRSGNIRWENTLKGLGVGLLSIAGTGAATSAEAKRRADHVDAG